MISRMLVPTDGSETAEKAARYAVDLAMQLNASVTILGVVDKRSLVSHSVAVDVATSVQMMESIEEYLRGAAEEHVGAIKRMCDKSGVASTTVIASGYPVEEIVKGAERARADLIVMGSHGRSALGAAVLGGVTYGVIHKDTKIPVLVVKR